MNVMDPGGNHAPSDDTRIFSLSGAKIPSLGLIHSHLKGDPRNFQVNKSLFWELNGH
jgi:hypothetical protein